MGMYDSILVHTKWTKMDQDIIFQTKDLDCLLDEYCINEDGELVYIRGCDWSEIEAPIRSINYTGELRLYDLDVEFVVYFIQGSLFSIRKT